MSILINRLKQQTLTLIPDINLILNISQITWAWSPFSLVSLIFRNVLFCKQLLFLKSQLNWAHSQIYISNTTKNTKEIHI